MVPAGSGRDCFFCLNADGLSKPPPDMVNLNRKKILSGICFYQDRKEREA